MKPTAREKRIIIIGACIAAAVLIYYGATKLLPDSGNLSQKVDLQKKLLLRQRETLSREGFYQTRLRQVKARLDAYGTRLLPGDNSNVAGAELQKILKDFADQSGVQITMKNILSLPEKKNQEPLTKVSVKIDTNCNLEQLVQFIAAIENCEKHLKIDDCTISGFRIQRRFEIRPSLTISGYISAREHKS